MVSAQFSIETNFVVFMLELVKWSGFRLHLRIHSHIVQVVVHRQAFLLSCPTKVPPAQIHSCASALLILETFLFLFPGIQWKLLFHPIKTTLMRDYFCCESDAQRCSSEYMQPNWDTLLSTVCASGGQVWPLKDIHVTLVIPINCPQPGELDQNFPSCPWR